MMMTNPGAKYSMSYSSSIVSKNPVAQFVI
jgi:hypothetical protein